MENNNREKKLLKLVIAAMFASLTCVATMIIKIPTPTNGYINIGDSVVLIAGSFLGPFYGVLSAAIGSMMADVFSGYIVYAPATFVIKGLMAYVTWLICGRLKQTNLRFIISALCAEIIMVVSYFLFEAFFMGQGLAAALGLTANAVQGAANFVLGFLLFRLFNRSRGLSEFLLIYKK